MAGALRRGYDQYTTNTYSSWLFIPQLFITCSQKRWKGRQGLGNLQTNQGIIDTNTMHMNNLLYPSASGKYSTTDMWIQTMELHFRLEEALVP